MVVPNSILGDVCGCKLTKIGKIVPLDYQDWRYFYIFKLVLTNDGEYELEINDRPAWDFHFLIAFLLLRASRNGVQHSVSVQIQSFDLILDSSWVLFLVCCIGSALVWFSTTCAFQRMPNNMRKTNLLSILSSWNTVIWKALWSL